VLELGFLLVFGFVCRAFAMTLVIKQHPPAWLFSRGTEMGFMATSILNGEGLSSPFGGHTGPTALIGPLYPLMIAGIFHIAGSYTLASEIIVLSIQVLVAVLNIWLVVRLADRLAGQQAGFFAGIFWACSPPVLFMPTIFWDTTFTACALTGMLLLTLKISGAPTKRMLVYTSIFFGLASLLNSALFFTSVALLAFLATRFSTARLHRFLLAITLFILTFSPWPIRNALVMRAFIPFRTTIGLELWMGNHEGSSGHLEEALFPLYNAKELAEYKRLGELGYNKEKTHAAMAYIQSRPAVFAGLTAQRTARFWLGTGSQNESRWLALHGILTTVFGLLGLALFAKRFGTKAAIPFAIPLILFPLPYYITHAEFRYRLVIDPIMTAFSAYSALMLIEMAVERVPSLFERNHQTSEPKDLRKPEPQFVQKLSSSQTESLS
jgi:hypothetical protein